MFNPRKTWNATSAESFRKCLAAWNWATTWCSLPEAARMPIAAAKLSCLLSVGQLLIGPNAYMGMTLGSAKWGGIALNVEPVDDPNNEDCFYRRPMYYILGVAKLGCM